MERKNSIELDDFQEEDNINFKENESRKRKRPIDQNQALPTNQISEYSCNLPLKEEPVSAPQPTANLKFEELIDYEITFHVSQFIEALIYHILFFYIFGPFLYPIMKIIGKENLAKNFGFWITNLYFWIQIVQYLVLSASLFGYFYCDTKYILPLEMIMLYTSVFFRMVVMAAKYGSFSTERYQRVKTTLLTVAEIRSELIIEEISEFRSKFIEKELKNVLIRTHIAKNLFFVQFLEKPEEEIMKRLEKPLGDPALKPRNASFASHGISGISFAKDIISIIVEKSYSISKLSNLSLLLAFLHSLIPYAYRAVTYGIEFSAGGSTIEYILTSAFFISSL